MPLLYKGTGAGGRTYSIWVNSNGSLHLSTWDNAASEYVSTDAGTVHAGQWYHVAAVLDRTNGQMRIVLDDAVAVSGGLRSAPSNAAGGALLLGKTPESAGDYAQFEGAIDDVRIWNVARSTADIIASRSTALLGAEGGLAFYLPVDENSGRTATDLVNGLPVAQLHSLVDGAEGVIAGRIGHPGQQARYTFTLASSALLYFDTLTDSNLQWSLSGPDGSIIANRTLRYSDGPDNWPFLGLGAGAYVLAIDGSGDETGPYAFRLLDTANAQAVTPGTPVSDVLAPGSETKMYRFTAAAGDRLYFDALSYQNGDSYWRLINPYGDQVFFTPVYNDIDVTTLTIPGTYTVFVEGRRYQTASTNAFSFNLLPVADKAATLVLGESQGLGPGWTTGQLGSALKLDTFDYAAVPNSPAVNQAGSLTVEAWFRVDAYANTWTPLVLKGAGGNWWERTYSLWL